MAEVITVAFNGQNDWLISQRQQNTPRSQGRDKALRTVAVLQTTLELDALLRLFSREVNDTVPHYGLTLLNEEAEVELTVGGAAKHICNYHLFVEKQDLGHITFMRGKAFTQQECSKLEFLLSSLVYPLRNALQYKSAFHASLTDALTGVYNRGFLDIALQRETNLARRYKNPLSLLILDIDCFKTINDAHGHKVGDQLIKMTANVITDCLRETDMLARYGGDEFIMLLSNTRSKGAYTLADHIRKTIAKTDCMVDDKVFNISVSIGVATLLKDDTSGCLFSRADEALLQAKRQGRNQVKVANKAQVRTEA